MSETVESFTFGHWRQAVTSFGILYPHDRHDWSDRSAVTPVAVKGIGHLEHQVPSSPTRLTIGRYVSPHRGNDSMATIVNQIQVLHTPNTQIGAVSSWVSEEFHPDIDPATFPLEDFINASRDAGTVALPLNVPLLPGQRMVPAPTPVLDFLTGNGYDRQQISSMVGETIRASRVITALTNDFVDVPRLFPPA